MERKKIFECQTCNKKFMRNTNLEKHELTHIEKIDDDDDDDYEEEEEDFNVKKKKIGKSKSMKKKKEKKKLNEEEYPIACDVLNCGFRCKTQRNLRAHVSVMHGEKKFKCDCGLSFATKGIYERHQEIHSLIRHHCEFCPKSFGRRITMLIHQKEKHSEMVNKKKEKETIVFKGFVKELREYKTPRASPTFEYNEEKAEYICKICGLAFDDETRADIHQSVHI